MKLKEIIRRIVLHRAINIIKYGREYTNYDTVVVDGGVYKFDMSYFKENH